MIGFTFFSKLYNGIKGEAKGQEQQQLGIQFQCIPGAVDHHCAKEERKELETGNEFVIRANNNSKENFYVDGIQLNGATYDKNYIKHAVIQDGGELNFSMSNSPNKKRGTTQESFPYSMTNEE